MEAIVIALVVWNVLLTIRIVGLTADIDSLIDAGEAMLSAMKHIAGRVYGKDFFNED